MKRPSVLIVDDDVQVLSVLAGFIKDQPWDIRMAHNGDQALQLLLEHPIDVAMVDLRMPGMSGFDVLVGAMQHGASTDIIILTAFGSVPDAVKAIQAGAVDFVQKPVEKMFFVEKIQNLIYQRMGMVNVLTERLVAFVTDHAADPNLTLSKLLDQFHISKSYACRLFGEIGTSFTDVLTQGRIDRAKQLMATTEDPLYAIAGLCGFKNSQRFSEAFYRLEGCSPSKYRQLGGLGRIK